MPRKGITQKEAEGKVFNKCEERNYTLIKPFVYKNNRIKIYLKCNKDGHEWNISYYRLINTNSGCPRCAGQVLYKEEIDDNINKKLKKINASLIESFVYKNIYSRPKLKCNTNGHEWTPTYHELVKGGNGCPKCAGKNLSKKETDDKIDKRLKEINASLIEPFIYLNNKSKLKLRCNIDGHEWYIQYYNLINNNKGCAKCAGILKITQEEAEEKVLEQCKIMNYILVKPFTYLTTQTTKIILKCNKCGHMWNVTYNNFIQHKSGCPKCNISKGEHEIEKILKIKNISYTTQKIFEKCKDITYLKFDFYLPKHNLCIEFDGIQHFKPIEFFGGEKTLKLQQKRDKIKNQYCTENNIDLIRIPYNKFNDIENIILDVV